MWAALHTLEVLHQVPDLRRSVGILHPIKALTVKRVQRVRVDPQIVQEIGFKVGNTCSREMRI